MRIATIALTALAGLALLIPGAAQAQETEPSWTAITVEGFGGVSDFGRFLEQDFGGGERELNIDVSAAFGGAVSVMPFKNTSFRLGYTWAGSDLEFDDDSGFDRSRLDADDLNKLFSNTFSLDVQRFLWSPEQRIAPYINAGITGTLWALGQEVDNPNVSGQPVIPGDSDKLWRWGGNAGLGAQVRLMAGLAARAEVTTFGLGNPFDGENAYRVTSGDTFAEPSFVNMTRASLGLTYLFDLG